MALRTSLVAQPHLYMGDTTGRPLDAGRVYFGRPNKDPEFYPINVFYDEALTIPAMQPIRTKGGFMNANGDMTEIYALETRYSVKVLDGHGRQVFYKEDMSSTSTASAISTQADIAIAITRNQIDKNNDILSITDFATADDAYNSAKITDKSIYVPSGEYLFTVADADLDMFYGVGTVNGLNLHVNAGQLNVLQFIPKAHHSKLKDLSSAISSGVDFRPWIQECFNKAEAMRKDVVFPRGYYTLGSGITLPQECKVIGLGMPYLLAMDNFVGDDIVSCDLAGQPHYSFENFFINGTGSKQVRGLHIGGCRNSVFKNLVFTSCHKAGVEIYPTHSDSGDVENFELNHIWTVLSPSLVMRANSTLNRGNITNGVVHNCQFTSGEGDIDKGYAIYIEADVGKLIFGIDFHRIFTATCANHHIVINPKGGSIFANKFSSIDGETHGIGSVGTATSVKPMKEAVYILDGEFHDNTFTDFYRTGMPMHGLVLSAGVKNNTFDGLIFLDLAITGLEDNRWLNIINGANDNTFTNVSTKEYLDASNVNTLGATAKKLFGNKIIDGGRGNIFTDGDIQTNINTLVKRDYLFELNGSSLKNVVATGLTFAANGNSYIVTIPQGSTKYSIKIPLVAPKYRQNFNSYVSFLMQYLPIVNTGLIVKASICGNSVDIDTSVEYKEYSVGFHGDYNSENAFVEITFEGTRAGVTSINLHDIVIGFGRAIPYSPNYIKHYIEN